MEGVLTEAETSAFKLFLSNHTVNSTSCIYLLLPMEYYFFLAGACDLRAPHHTVIVRPGLMSRFSVE